MNRLVIDKCTNCYAYNSPCLNHTGFEPDQLMSWENFKKESNYNGTYEKLCEEMNELKKKKPYLFIENISCIGPYNDTFTRCFGECCN